MADQKKHAAETTGAVQQSANLSPPFDARDPKIHADRCGTAILSGHVPVSALGFKFAAVYATAEIEDALGIRESANVHALKMPEHGWERESFL